MDTWHFRGLLPTRWGSRLPGGCSAAAPRGAPPRPAPLGQPGGAGLAGHPLAGSVPAAAFCQGRASAQGTAALVSPWRTQSTGISSRAEPRGQRREAGRVYPATGSRQAGFWTWSWKRCFLVVSLSPLCPTDIQNHWPRDWTPLRLHGAATLSYRARLRPLPHRPSAGKACSRGWAALVPAVPLARWGGPGGPVCLARPTPLTHLSPGSPLATAGAGACPLRDPRLHTGSWPHSLQWGAGAVDSTSSDPDTGMPAGTRPPCLESLASSPSDSRRSEPPGTGLGICNGPSLEA